MSRFIIVLSLMVGLLPMSAHAYSAVKDEASFRALVDGKLLRNRLYGVRLNVLPDGTIAGSAIGWDITGTWVWQDGFFCRDLSWGGDQIPYNCQLVEAHGDNIRFTVDQGSGDSAAFSLN